jgi:uncharacterized membrane protein YdjX (TVP38/TMEM64 family)
MEKIKYFLASFKKFEQETGLNLSYIIVAILILMLVGHFLNIQSIKLLVLKVGFWGPVVIILAKIMTIVIAPLSGAPIYLLAGTFWGFPQGLIYVAIGDFVGYTTAFYIARILGREAVNKMISRNEQALFSRIINHLGTFKGFIQSCFIFFSLPELLSYGTGLTRLSYIKFISVIFPASCVGTGLVVLAGDYLGQFSSYSWWLAILPILGLIMMVLGIWFFAKNIKKN